MEILEKCRSVIEHGPKSEIDEYSLKEMKKYVKSHLHNDGPYLSELAFLINGRQYEHIYDALIAEDDVETIDIRFLKPKLDEVWDFDAPTQTIKMMKGGFGGIAFFNYDPKALDKWAKAGELIEKKAMIRAFPVDFFVPRSIATMSKHLGEDPPDVLIPQLWTMESMLKNMREVGALPITVRICAYTKEERFAYDIDLLRNRLLRDPRAGKMQPTQRVKRSPEEYFYFDRIYASLKMGHLPKAIFEAVFESDGLTASDISHFFRITTEMAVNNLKALEKRGLLNVEGKPPFETYGVTHEILEKGAWESKT